MVAVPSNVACVDSACLHPHEKVSETLELSCGWLLGAADHKANSQVRGVRYGVVRTDAVKAATGHHDAVVTN